jgi:hypothetical protein
MRNGQELIVLFLLLVPVVNCDEVKTGFAYDKETAFSTF